MNDYKELIDSLRICVKYRKAADALCNAEFAADVIEQLVKERDAAVKCIEDIETYLQWGAPQYAYKVIEEWRGVTDEYL